MVCLAGWLRGRVIFEVLTVIFMSNYDTFVGWIFEDLAMGDAVLGWLFVGLVALAVLLAFLIWRDWSREARD